MAGTTKRRPLSIAAALLCVALAPGGCDRVTALLDRGQAASDSPPKPASAEVIAATPVGAAPTIATPQPPTPAPAPANVAAVAASAVPATTAPAAVPCIVGHWKAIDYLAEIRRAIHRDPALRSMKHSSSGGFFGYEIDPPVDGKGAVRAKAESLRYAFSGKVEGLKIDLAVTLDGETEAAYTLVGDDKIVVSTPSRNTMKARGVAKVAGLGKYSKSPKVDPDFDGTFVYSCDATKLKVWREARSGEPLDFERETD